MRFAGASMPKFWEGAHLSLTLSSLTQRDKCSPSSNMAFGLRKFVNNKKNNLVVVTYFIARISYLLLKLGTPPLHDLSNPETKNKKGI